MSHSTVTLSPPKPTTTYGQLYIWLAVFGFGLNPLFARLAYLDGLSPELLILYRSVIPLLFSFPFLRQSFRYGRLVPIALAVGIGMSVGTWLYFRALAVLPIPTISLVYYSYPLFTILIGRILFKEPLTLKSMIVLGLISTAAYLIIRPEGFSSTQIGALMLSFAAPISFAFLLQSMEHWLSPMPAVSRFSLLSLGQLVVAVPFIFLIEAPFIPLTSTGWIGLLGVTFLSSCIPQALYAVGIPLTGATRTAIIGSAELVIVLLSGWLILNEPLIWREILGAALILSGILLSSITFETTG